MFTADLLSLSLLYFLCIFHFPNVSSSKTRFINLEERNMCNRPFMELGEDPLEIKVYNNDSILQGISYQQFTVNI